MEFYYDKSASSAYLETAGCHMDAFNHSGPFKNHVIYVLDYLNDHIRLFTVKQTDFNKIKMLLHISSDMLASVVTEFVSKSAKGKLNTKESDTLAPALVGYAKSAETYRSWRRVSEATERLHIIINIYAGFGFLRSLIARTTETVLTTKKMLVLSSQIKSMDAANHSK